ncbi:hypothetical protein D3C87_334240 [compost metagenome]|jgi:hypothetical protein
MAFNTAELPEPTPDLLAALEAAVLPRSVAPTAIEAPVFDQNLPIRFTNQPRSS